MLNRYQIILKVKNQSLLFNEIILNDPDNPYIGAVEIEFKDATFTPGDLIASDFSEKFSTNFNSTTGKMTISPVNSQITTEDLQDFLRGFTFSSSSKNPVIDKDFRQLNFPLLILVVELKTLLLKLQFSQLPLMSLKATIHQTIDVIRCRSF